MNKIYINGRFLNQKITGVQRYAVEVVKQFDLMLEKNIIDKNLYSIEILKPKGNGHDLNLKHIKTKEIGNLKGHAWEQFELPLYTRGTFLLNLCQTGPIFKTNQSVTIHDAAVYGFPNAFSFLFRSWYKILLRALGITAKQIFTVSEFSKDQLNKYFKINKKKIKTIYLGKEHLTNIQGDISILEREHLLEKKYVLAVSSMNPNKNFKSIVEAIDIIGDCEFDIVIAGGTNPKIFSSFDVSSLNKVRYLGYVSDNELKSLYEHAECFIFPSFYEGFGLPPIEAMSSGCPVVVSNTSSIPEVCGEAAVYCNPNEPENIAQKIIEVMGDGKLRESLKQKGMEKCSEYNWEKCAYETFKVIYEII